MTTWLISDTHFGHAKVANLRGFLTSAAHDAVILRNLQRVVRPEDTCWWLGDVALGDWRFEIAQLREIAGAHHLVLGNHDRAHPLNSNGHNYTKTFLTEFDSVQTSAKLRYQGRSVLLSHFPYDGDTPGSAEDRYPEWRLRDEGKILIHGHTHSPERLSYSKAGTPQVNVSAEAWAMRPATLSEAVALATSPRKDVS